MNSCSVPDEMPLCSKKICTLGNNMYLNFELAFFFMINTLYGVFIGKSSDENVQILNRRKG